ncbi:hypothetical protein AVEN_120413-1 [Araneus ventricosus]|uniref:Uncharacterized protein n=1 Tax=Araneus ventricosus TaxID=182803 RepID=A0A4Y2MZ38_ARAVE|nr:hypothetical protein AVEN_120413-1 [Araneus ventricosus]
MRAVDADNVQWTLCTVSVREDRKQLWRDKQSERLFFTIYNRHEQDFDEENMSCISSEYYDCDDKISYASSDYYTCEEDITSYKDFEFFDPDLRALNELLLKLKGINEVLQTIPLFTVDMIQ